MSLINSVSRRDVPVSLDNICSVSPWDNHVKGFSDNSLSLVIINDKDTIYHLLKAEISLFLLWYTSVHWTFEDVLILFVVLAVSDSCASGNAVDKSGPNLERLVVTGSILPNANVFDLCCVPDKVEDIKVWGIFCSYILKYSRTTTINSCPHVMHRVNWSHGVIWESISF